MVENLTYTVSELTSLESKVEHNVATVSDYIRLENFLASMGLKSPIKVAMDKYGFKNFDDYMINRTFDKKDTSAVTGTILGVITVLKKHL